MHKSKIFLILILSFIGGLLYRSFWSVEVWMVWLSVVFSLVIFFWDYKNKNNVVWSLLVIFFLLGVGRIEMDLKKIAEIKIPNQSISTKAFIIKEPEKKEFYQNLIVSVIENDLFKNNSATSQKLLIKTDLYRDFKYGEQLEISCSPEIIKNSSQDFDYRMYLAKDKIYYTCPKAQLKKTGEYRVGVYGFILNTRNRLENNIKKIIPQPEATLGGGLLFGGSGGLSKEMQEIFSATGMTHIVAVSGYNVTIIVQYLMLAGIFFGLWRPQAFYFALLGIFLFVAMIGFPSSAVRAGVMGSLILWAIKNGRLASVDNAIILAGAIMLIINPLLLRWDVGFQLSFLATLGLVKLAPFWEKYFIEKYDSLGIMEIVLMSISAQLFVLPIILYNFHKLSLISVIANVFVLPIIPVTMLLVFLSALISFIFYPVALMLGYLAWGLLKYEIKIIEFLGSFKWSSVEVASFNEIGLVIWYLILISAIYLFNRKNIKEIQNE